MGIRETLFDVRWQVIRCGTFARHNPLGGWGTAQGTRYNLVILREYLEGSSGEANVRLYRVNNLLTSVLKGYRGQQRVDTTMYQAVARFRHDMPHHNAQEEITWSWDKVREDLERLMREDPDMFNNVRRLNNAQLKKTHGGGDTRPELAKFLGLMKEVTDENRPTQLDHQPDSVP